MHGSPLAKWDNRDLWKNYNYRDFGIIAEPYFDMNFGEVLYITDTGRRWNGDKVSVRDKVKRTGGKLVESPSRCSFQGNSTGQESRKGKVGNLRLRYTEDIIEAVERGMLPDKIMLNIHPQRWDDGFGPWMKELVWQNVKNIVKRAFYVKG